MKPVIDVISLGGTIAMKDKSGSAGVVPTLSADDLVQAVPQLAEIAAIRTHSPCNVPSAHLTFEDIFNVASKIRMLAQEGSAGFVITQGTDTIEETAYALDLLLRLEVPVVVTGAMRNPTKQGADGPANILAAVQVAVEPAAKSLGSLVVFNDEIHSAQFVRKTHTSNPSTFRSDPLGPIGWLTEDEVRIHLEPKSRPVLGSSEFDDDVRVAIIKLGLGDDGRLIDAAVTASYSGLVIEGLGGGHASVSAANALERACAKIPVVLASRTGAGEVLTSTYGFVGSEIDLLSKGLVPAGRLDGCRARVLLTLLLCSKETSVENIADAFLSHGTQ
ncbi:asparaginase [Sneathiella sp. CAU 1612]|uniref:Asparaginase n=1 Tax=Sneathiella sedimenti TaxID=2816034 RepID=A0ABS3F889_9PROT|nr:asparaginase [Sneathiella sedimenti]MBO0334731.1 asparaginase [Sneathiella sedimenti]